MDLYNYFPKVVKARNESMHLRFRPKMQPFLKVHSCSQTSPFSRDINESLVFLRRYQQKLLTFIPLHFLSEIKDGLEQASN